MSIENLHNHTWQVDAIDKTASGQDSDINYIIRETEIMLNVTLIRSTGLKC